MTHCRPVFNPRTRTRRPIRPRTVRRTSTEASCSPRRLSQMAPSVMAPTRSGSSLCALIASFPTRNGTDPELIPTLLMYPTNQQSNPIHWTNRLNSGLDTQFADEGFIRTGGSSAFCSVVYFETSARSQSACFGEQTATGSGSSAYTSRTALLTKRRAVRSTNHSVTKRA